MNANEFNDRFFRRTHKITGEKISETGLLSYTVQREETSLETHGTKTVTSELQLSFAALLCEENGFQLLKDWIPKQGVKNGYFRYEHQIVEQIDSPEGKLYKVERKITHSDSRASLVKESFVVPVQIMLRCDAGGDLLKQWETPSPSNVRRSPRKDRAYAVPGG